MDRRTKIALCGAGLGLVSLFAVWFAAFHIGFVERADQQIFNGFGGIRYRPHVSPVAWHLAILCNVNPYVFLCVIPVAIALVRRRPIVAVTVVGILLGANATTQLIKPLLAQTRAHSLLAAIYPPPDAASWPSGHATAAMALALCLVLASPRRYRPVAAAVGAAFTIAVVYSFLTLGWHYPTDVLGGFLVATTWTLLGAAALFAADGRLVSGRVAEDALPASRALGPPVATLAGALAVAAVITLARPDAITSYTRAHETFVVGAVGIGALALALATGFLLALGRESP